MKSSDAPLPTRKNVGMSPGASKSSLGRVGVFDWVMGLESSAESVASVDHAAAMSLAAGTTGENACKVSGSQRMTYAASCTT